MRYFAIGDIHGNFRGLMECICRAKFNFKEDTLIGLGDYTDGHPESFEVIEFLSSLPNFIGIRGNHDAWVSEWLTYGHRYSSWVQQGGKSTIESYEKKDKFDKVKHSKFFKDLHDYVVLTINNKKYAFVHGGWKDERGLGYDVPDVYRWDRKLWEHISARTNSDMYKYSIKRTVKYDWVFLGHTSTDGEFDDLPPIRRFNVINLDQGAGGGGRLTICDIEKLECWQSRPGFDIYPIN